MIKSTVKGFYDISIDGGKTFIYSTKNLVLNNYYSKTFLTDDMTLVIGSGNTPPDLTDNGLASQFGVSTTETGFDLTPVREIFADRFEVTYSKTFDLGVGYANTLRELGIKNPNLISRALLKAADGTPITVALAATDHVIIRYSITYIIPRAPVYFNVTINNVSVVASVKAVNVENGAWGSITPAEVTKYDKFGVDVAGTWTLDVNDNVIGGNLTNDVTVITNINGTSNLNITGTVAAGTGDWNQTFQQILITSSGVNFLTAPILIDLDQPVTKNAAQVVNISITVNQAA